MFQANQAFQQIVEATGGVESPFYQKGWVGGAIFATIVGFIIIGGIKSIGRVTEKLVPFMAIVYVLSCLVIIFSNYNLIPETLTKIFSSTVKVIGSIYVLSATSGSVMIVAGLELIKITL